MRATIDERRSEWTGARRKILNREYRKTTTECGKNANLNRRRAKQKASDRPERPSRQNGMPRYPRQRAISCCVVLCCVVLLPQHRPQELTATSTTWRIVASESRRQGPKYQEFICEISLQVRRLAGILPDQILEDQPTPNV
jgi:hypothetical protein